MGARAHSRFWALAIVVVAGVAFWPALRNEFNYDDRPQVREIAVPESAGEWLAAPFEPWWPADHGKNLWRPLPRMTILVQKALHPQLPMLFFAVNILLHIGVSLILWALARRLGLSAVAAGLAGLIFAIHPIHVEPVHQVVGRAETLAALAILAGLWCWTRGGLRGAAYWQQPLALGIAMASKEHAVVYPVVLAAATLALPAGRPLPPGAVRFSLRPLRRPEWWLLMALLGAVIALFLFGRAMVTGGLIEPVSQVPFHENPLAQLGFFERLPGALGFFFYTLVQMIAPFGLSPDYSVYSLPYDRGWGWPLAWGGGLALVALAGWCARDAWRGGRGWLLAAATIAPWLLISNILFTIGTIHAERLWYLPSLGICLALGWMLAPLARRLPDGQFRPAVMLPVLWLLVLLVANLFYAGAWRDQLGHSWWTVRRFPDSWRGNVNLARELYMIRQFETGLRHASHAVEQYPDGALGWNWLGVNAMFTGRFEQAEAAFTEALRLEPELHKVHNYWALLEHLRGRPEAALERLEIYLATGDSPDPERQRRMFQELLAGRGGQMSIDAGDDSL